MAARLTVEIKKAGDGKHYPKPGDTVVIHYSGNVRVGCSYIVVVLLMSIHCQICWIYAENVVEILGYLMDGTRFDSSRDRGKPFKFKLGCSQVIPGLGAIIVIC